MEFVVDCLESFIYLALPLTNQLQSLKMQLMMTLPFEDNISPP